MICRLQGIADKRGMVKTKFQGFSELNKEQTSAVKRAASSETAKRSSPASAAYFIAAIVLILGSPYASEHPWIIYPALAIFTISLAIRLVILIRFDSIYDFSIRLWCGLNFSAVIAAAITWASISSLAIYYYENTWTSLLTTAATAAICAGGLLSIGMNKRLTQAHVTIILLPNLIVSMVVGGYGMVAFFLTYLAYCLIQSRYIYTEFWNSRINAMRLDAETKQRLHQLTYLDSLTNLPNRELFHDRLQQSIHDAKRRNNFCGVMFVGLDRFSKINDTLGHHCGDELLKDVSVRIQNVLRENDTVARYSGDTFAITINSLDDAQVAARIANKIIDSFAQPFELAGLELFITTSIGISLYPIDGNEQENLIKNAESTMYQVKQQGGCNYQYYKSDIHAESMEQLQLETKLRHALERNEFVLYYQPKINLHEGVLSGFEALLRWLPQNSEMVSPVKFIPILESTGLIVEVGEWVLRQACLQAKEWQKICTKQFRMAVNLSARQFKHAGLAEMVARVLSETGLDAEWLELEITESMLMEDTEHTFMVLRQLQDMGIHLSIDDFGTGYSSLAYLKRMPINSLKIDRSFVKDITTDSSDAAVVQTIIAMAHNLNLTVVAEGTETAEQVSFLRYQQCDETQGFYFSRPLPADELREMLQSLKHWLSDQAARDIASANNFVLISSAT